MSTAGRSAWARFTRSDRHTLAKLMGHSSPRITEKYYIHVTEPHISSGFERFMAYQAKRLQAINLPQSVE